MPQDGVVQGACFGYPPKASWEAALGGTLLAARSKAAPEVAGGGRGERALYRSPRDDARDAQDRRTGDLREERWGTGGSSLSRGWWQWYVSL